MIPLRDVVPTRLTPWATLALALAHLALPTHPVHVAVNVLALWLFGGAIEDRLGRSRFLLLFAMGGAAGLAVALAAAPPETSRIAAQPAAIGAIIGGYLRLFPTARVLVLVPVPGVFDVVELPALFFAGSWIVVQLLLAPGAIVDAGPAGGLAWWTTAAGLATGLAAAQLLRRRARMEPAWWDARDRPPTG